MQTFDQALESLKVAAISQSVVEVRESVLSDIVAGLSGFSWGVDDEKWTGKFDHVVDLLAEKIGGHQNLGYLTLYLLERLVARNFISATGEKWPDDHGELVAGLLKLKPLDSGPEGLKILMRDEGDPGTFGLVFEVTAA